MDIPQRRAGEEEGGKSVVGVAVDEAIKLSVWRNISKYIILGSIAAFALNLAVSLGVVLVVGASIRDADTKHARVVCAALRTFASAETVAAQQQQLQTAGLLKQGFTFGIPRKQFERLSKASAQQQNQRLATLAAITRLDCQAVEQRG